MTQRQQLDHLAQRAFAHMLDARAAQLRADEALGHARRARSTAECDALAMAVPPHARQARREADAAADYLRQVRELGELAGEAEKRQARMVADAVWCALRAACEAEQASSEARTVSYAPPAVAVAA